MDVEALKRLAADSDRIVFFGGAGTSTESGIPDFRSQSGLFQTLRGTEHAPEEMLSHTFFMKHPEEFYRFYREKMIYPAALPNAGHRVLARLEAEGRLKAVITQNIDGLHQAAGSRHVLELHGSIHRNYCMTCGAFYALEDWYHTEPLVPVCKMCSSMIKPDVVLYEEKLNDRIFREAQEAIAEADLFIVAGTSLSVYPANGLLRYYRGDKLMLINKSPTPFDGSAHYLIPDSFSSVMVQMFADEHD